MSGNRISRRQSLGLFGAAAAAATLPAPALRAQTLDKFSYQTNWRAQAEHGGFYQAVATGIYRKYGIDADIRMGGPQQDPNTLLVGGRVDAIMSNSFAGFNYARENLPFVVVASVMQKDPQVLISHPGMGNDRLPDLKGKPILIGAGGRSSYWPWLKSKFGFTDDQARPYTFNMAPFLADKTLSQQGFLSSEPFAIEQAGVKPVVHLLADYGFEAGQREARSRAALRQRLDRGLGLLPQGRSGTGQCADQARQPRHGRRQDRLCPQGDERQGHRRLGRLEDARRGLHDRRALEELLRGDGRRRRAAGRPRPVEGLYAALREQARRDGMSAAGLTIEAAGQPAGRAARPVVSCRGVAKLFSNGTLALQNVDLDIGRHQFVSLLGPSGCGKSTLLRLIAGLGEASAGTIDWPEAEHDSTGAALPSLSFVFQEPTLMPWANAIKNVMLPLKLAGVKPDEQRARAAEALRMVGLASFENAYPRELSGGMKMRVSIARAMVTRPQVLLMDEPFAALDEITRFKLNNDLLELWHASSFTVVFVTHSVFESVFLSQRIVTMAARPGRVIADMDVTAPYPRASDYRTSPLYNAHCKLASEALERAMGHAIGAH
jgi:NitT/TauT family transport system ATP-binding protein